MCIEEVSKPTDWPANKREELLENVINAVKAFLENPCYVTKECLISLVSSYDLNQYSSEGMCRVTDYEVFIINLLYLHGRDLLLPILRCFLYELVGRTTREHKMLHYITNSKEFSCNGTIIPLEINSFKHLYPALYLYYICYQAYTVNKDKSFADKIIETTNKFLELSKSKGYSNEEKYKLQRNLKHAYVTMLNDLSCFSGNKENGIWKFDRNELIKLFSMESKLFTLVGENPVERPNFGVLKIQISNFVLKSRHNYNSDYICKYLPAEISSKSFINHEIWIREIEYLNDDREGAVINDLLKDNEWIDADWISFDCVKPTRNYYLSCFSKNYDSNEMKEKYGNIVYGFKNDRIGELISPIHRWVSEDKSLSKPIEIYSFSQVVAFDVLYDKAEVKKELNYLFKIVELFDLDNAGKNTFLKSILQYWLFSVKDPKWSYEKERRYVLFLYDDYDYLETKLDDSVLKTKTSLFFLPDFVFGNPKAKEGILNCITDKMKSLSYKPYLFCKNCLNRDFDIASLSDRPLFCPICGSSDTEIKIGNRPVTDYNIPYQ